jgi:hypothetical protein
MPVETNRSLRRKQLLARPLMAFFCFVVAGLSALWAISDYSGQIATGPASPTGATAHIESIFLLLVAAVLAVCGVCLLLKGFVVTFRRGRGRMS